MSINDNPVSSAIKQLSVVGEKELPRTGIVLSDAAIELIKKSSAQIQSSTEGAPSRGGPPGSPGFQDEGKNASLAKGLLGIVSAVAVPFGSLSITAMTKGKFSPLQGLIDAFDSLGAPRDPNETLGERYSSIIEETKYSDPNRDTAYGHIGGPNSYSLPGTSFTHNISDEDVLGLTREEAEKNLNVVEFQSTNPDKEAAPGFATQAEIDASTVGVGTAAATAAARGASRPSIDYGFGEMGSKSGGQSRSDAPFGGIEGDTSGNPGGAGVGAGDESSSAPGHGSPGAWNTGGRIGALIQHLQTGGDVENAETDLGNANVPMGVVDDPDGAPSPFSGGTGVEDDLDMDVEAGSYVLNAEAVQLIGISDINAVIRDAYSIAAALGKPMPQDYDPQNKVPIRISNGEAVIPKALVDIIGLDKLEKWNQKGLELRKQKEEFMAKQQQQQPPQQQQIATEAPMQQQMQQLMANGTLVKTVEQLKEAETQEARDFFRQKAEEQEEAGTQVPIEDVREWIRKQAEQVEPTAANLQRMFQSGEPINQGITVEKVPEPIEKVSNESIRVPIKKPEAPSLFTISPSIEKNLFTIKNKMGDSINLDNALKFAEIVSSFESINNPNAIQDNDLQKRGRGLFQFERNFSTRNQGAETAVNRVENFDPSIPWLSKFKNTTFDVVEADLTPQEQTELFIINHTVHGKANFIDTTNNFNPNTAFEYYKKYHYGGKNPPKKGSKRYKEFMNIAKKIINR